MATKKTSKEILKEVATPVSNFPKRTEVPIEKAKNGYVVSSYCENGRNLYVAKTQTEAKNHANKLLKISK